MRSALAASGKDGLATEAVTVNTWNNDGFYYVRVRGRNGTFDVANPFQLSVAVNGGVCAGLSDSGLRPTSLTAVANNYTTLILTDQGQLEALYGETAVNDLLTLLDTLSMRPEVNGVMVNVGADDRVADARTLLNDYLTCPAAQNILADAIKAVIDAYWQANPDLRYLVLVGNDQVIPFYRHPDQALLAPESNYVVPVLEGSPSDASLELNYLLSQDSYGSQLTISMQNIELPVPALGIGRLVETPSDMTAVLNAYLSTSDGVITPATSLVTGYDFLEDAALAVDSQLRLGIGTIPDQLITPQTVAPENAWTSDQLRTALLQSGRHDLVYMAGHFSAGSALAADYQSRLLASEVANSAVDMSNSLIFSAGCHAGYNVVNADGIPLLTPEPDWAQAFAQKGAALVAGTGYQYGDSDFIEYGERLYLLFSQELRTGTGPVSVGEALAAAKQAYLVDVGSETSGIYQKQMLIATLFGLPMLQVDMPGQRIVSGEGASIVTGTNGYGLPGPGQTLDLQFADVTITPTLTLMTQTLVNVNNVNEEITVSYLTGGSDERVLVNPAEPVLPLQTFNVAVPGQVLRGVGFRSGQYSGWQEIRPLTGAATYDLSGPRPIFASDFFYPAKLWNVNYYDAIINPTDGETQLVLTPAQFQSDTPGSTTGTLRQFDQMQFRLFYSNNTNTYSGNTPYLSNPPGFSQVLATINGGQVDFAMRVVGDPAAGIQEVWITWSDVTDVNGMWQSLDLMQDTADSTLWQGSLTAVDLNGTLPENVRYMVQAVNGVGLVTLATNVGRFYEPNVDPGEPAVNGAATDLVLDNPPSSGAYGEMVELSAVLTSDGSPLANQLIRFTLGTERTAVTDQNGRATVSLPISAVPGVYELQASFGGTADYQPVTASAPFTVTKQVVTLTLAPAFNSILPGEDSEMVVTLRDTDDNALVQKPVLLVVDGPEGSYALLGVTNFLGQVSLGPVTLPPGSYTVTAHFGDSFTLPDNTLVDLTDNNYDAATAVATLVIEGDDHEILYISLSTSGSVAGIDYNDEDILAYDTVADSWSLYFDGSDVGLAPRDLDAFAIAGDGTLLLSVASPLPLVNVGWVDDSDIVRFIPTSLGDNTIGTFEMYLDASDVGLTTLDEDIDALDFAPDGRLLVSTVGPFSVLGASGTDADLIAFTASSLGQNSAGTWAFYFDGSDVGLTTDKEDIWGVWTDETNGDIYLTTKSKFTVPGLDGGAEDIFVCTPVTLGGTTSCTFTLYWDGSAYGFARKQVDDFAIVR